MNNDDLAILRITDCWLLVSYTFSWN